MHIYGLALYLIHSNIHKVSPIGVPMVAQQKQIRLGTMRLQVQSLVIPSLGTPYAVGAALKKGKKNKIKNYGVPIMAQR